MLAHATWLAAASDPTGPHGDSARAWAHACFDDISVMLAVRAASQVCLWQVGGERHDAHCDASGAAVGGALRGKEVRGLVRRGGGSFAPY